MEKINGKALYAPKGAAMEYGRIGCNFYTGCPHNCEYCYLKRGTTGKALGGTEVKLKKCFKDEADAAHTLRNELDKYLEQCQRYGIFLSFITDPLIEETRLLTSIAISEATFRDIPVWVLTKCSTFIYDLKLMEWLKDINPTYRDRIHFGFTLTGRDDMEPKANTNADRIMAMREMHLMGFSTFASIEPVIDWSSSIEMIQKSLEYCKHYKIGLRSGVKKDYYDAAETYTSVLAAKQMILNAGRMVYFKESVRNWMLKNVGAEPLRKLLHGTLDMDGHVIQ